ncbi:MAG TPA: multidrug efflux SMR transporter [Arenibaculum sp.]|nr:multidrug efflux SMR transporter [Arenibaculum sp.]
MSWIYLSVAIVLEVCGTTAMKLSDGLTRIGPTVLVVLFYSVSFVCLATALRRLDVGVAYAIWSGAGTAVVAVIGWLWFGEALGALKLVSLCLVVAGVVGLKLSAGHA